MTDFDTSRAHPTANELADLHEGLLDGADESRVRDHTATCDECRAMLAAVEAVGGLLREAGSTPISMPADVARSIDGAIAAESARQTAEPALLRLESRRRPHRSPSWVRPAFNWVAAAAAAVVVIGGLGVGLSQLGGGSDDSASGGATSETFDSGGGSAEGGQRPEPQADKLAQGRLLLDRENVQHVARRLAAAEFGESSGGKDVRITPTASKCARPQGVVGIRFPARWYGSDAWLLVRREARVASVYSCGATPDRLYSASY